MKIAILSCFYPFRGGIAQFNANLLTELSKRYEVRAFNFTRQYPEFLFPGKSQKVTPQDNAQVVESTALLDTVNPINWHRTASTIRSWSPDVLIVRYWMSYFAPSLGTVARHIGKNCKVIAIIDNVIPHEKRFFDKAFTSWFLKGVDGCVTLCSEVASDLLSISSTKPYAVIPHPVYSHFGPKITRKEAFEKLFPNRKSNSNEKFLLFFGLIREYKGLDILLEAFRRLDNSYHLIIAGEPYGSFEKYQNIIDSIEGKERIHLYSEYIPDSEVKYYFGAADVVVLPYRSATQSGVSAISNFFELPMIVTNVGGLKETIGDSGIGLVCDEISPEAIANIIIRYFCEPGLRESLTENLHKKNENLSWNNFCKKMLSFINSI